MVFAALLFLLNNNNSNFHLKNVVLAVASYWPNVENMATQIEYLFKCSLNTIDKSSPWVSW
jgi:hypothetical protein